MKLGTIFDFYGIGMKFTIKRDTKFRTIPGSIISLFIFVLILTTIYGFYFYYSNFKIIKSLIQIDDTKSSSPPVSLENDIMTGYQIYYDGLSIDRELSKKMFNVTSGFYQRNQSDINFKIGDCQKIFGLNKVNNNSLKNFDLSTYDCVISSNNSYVTGGWSEKNYSYMHLDVSFCDKNVDSNCYNISKIEKLIYRRYPYIRIIYMDAMNNFSSYDNPFERIMKFVEVPIFFNSNTEFNFDYGRDDIYTDTGYFLNPNYSSPNSIIKMKSLKWFTFNRNDIFFLRLYFNSSFYNTHFYRIYSKLYELVVYVVVICKVIINLGGICNNWISGFLFKYYLSTSLFYFDDNLLEDEKISKLLDLHNKKELNNLINKTSNLFKKEEQNVMNPFDDLQIKNQENESPQNINKKISPNLMKSSTIKLDPNKGDSIYKKESGYSSVFGVNNESSDKRKIIMNILKEDKRKPAKSFPFSIDLSEIIKPEPILEREEFEEFENKKFNLEEIDTTQRQIGQTKFFHSWELPFFLICKGFIRVFCWKKLHYKHLLLKKSFDILDDYLDVDNLIRKTFEIDFLKFVLLDRNQMKLLNFINKPEISLINSINVHSFSRIFYNLKDYQFHDIYEIQRMKSSEIRDFLLAYNNVLNKTNFSLNDNKLLSSIDKNFRYLNRFIKK